MHCTIGWLDCHGRDTHHDEPPPAIGYAVWTAPHRGGPERYPICGDHYETLSMHRDHHAFTCSHRAFWFREQWRFEPFCHHTKGHDHGQSHHNP
jgi:hypothetical protein